MPTYSYLLQPEKSTLDVQKAIDHCLRNKLQNQSKTQNGDKNKVKSDNVSFTNMN